MPNEAKQAVSIVSDLVQAWIGGVQHFYDGMSDSDGALGPEDVLRETSHFITAVMPVAERGVGLTLDLLRPWSKAFEERVNNA